MTPEVVHEHFLKVPVANNANFTIYFEQHVKGTFIHCDVSKYNSTVKREIMQAWSSIKELHGGPIYALHDFTDRKHEKFLKMFGFRRHQVQPNLKEIWIWRKTDGQSIQK